MTFGIPVKGFPLTHDGEILLENHKELLNRRRNLDEKRTDLGRIILPGPYDVLFGRGKSFQEHPGNMRYRQLIESHMEMYEAANKIEKTGMFACHGDWGLPLDFVDFFQNLRVDELMCPTVHNTPFWFRGPCLHKTIRSCNQGG
jgi:hypothetical protein